MKFSEYQREAARTRNPAIESDYRESSLQSGLGIAGEAGEVADYLKKVIFHGHQVDVTKLVKELGDVLWYIADLATTNGIDLDDVAQANIEKLKKRYPEGFTSAQSIHRTDEPSET